MLDENDVCLYQYIQEEGELLSHWRQLREYPGYTSPVQSTATIKFRRSEFETSEEMLTS
jgi:hypothetical protein